MEELSVAGLVFLIYVLPVVAVFVVMALLASFFE